MKSIIIIFLFFCLISKRGAADQEYQQIDLYAETSFLKENKKHRVKKLNLEQKKELATNTIYFGMEKRKQTFLL